MHAASIRYKKINKRFYFSLFPLCRKILLLNLFFSSFFSSSSAFGSKIKFMQRCGKTKTKLIQKCDLRGMTANRRRWRIFKMKQLILPVQFSFQFFFFRWLQSFFFGTECTLKILANNHHQHHYAGKVNMQRK